MKLILQIMQWFFLCIDAIFFIMQTLVKSAAIALGSVCFVCIAFLSSVILSQPNIEQFSFNDFKELIAETNTGTYFGPMVAMIVFLWIILFSLSFIVLFINSINSRAEKFSTNALNDVMNEELLRLEMQHLDRQHSQLKSIQNSLEKGKNNEK